MNRLIVTALLVWTALQTDTMTMTITTSNNFTLTSSVTYTVELSSGAPGTSVPSGSTAQLIFSSFFDINGTTLSNCKATISSSVALSTQPCSPSNDGSSYYVHYDSLFSTSATITYLAFSVLCSD